MHAVRRVLAVAAAAALLLGAGASAAQAHEERASVFPPGNGADADLPAVRRGDAAARGVQARSAALIAAIDDAKVKALNTRLLGAVQASRTSRPPSTRSRRRAPTSTSCPGTYREEP